MFPQPFEAVHWIEQLVASVQSIAEHASAAVHAIVQSKPLGHVTEPH
jgi:hypothetical protein